MGQGVTWQWPMTHWPISISGPLCTSNALNEVISNCKLPISGRCVAVMIEMKQMCVCVCWCVRVCDSVWTDKYNGAAERWLATDTRTERLTDHRLCTHHQRSPHQRAAREPDWRHSWTDSLAPMRVWWCWWSSCCSWKWTEPQPISSHTAASS